MLCGKLTDFSPNLPHNETSFLRVRVIPNESFLGRLQYAGSNLAKILVLCSVLLVSKPYLAVSV